MLPRLTWEEGLVLNQLYTDYTKVPEELEHLIPEAEKKNEELLHLYLSQKEFDIYFAASQRDIKDYEEAEKICRILEQIDKNIKIIRPASFAMKSNRQKGDLERLFLERSKCAFLLDMGKDTWGRNVEAAEMLLLHKKPVVILVSDTPIGKYASKYQIFKTIHPKNVIGKINDAWGMHVTKSTEEAVNCIKAILNNSVETKTVTEDGAKNVYCLGCGSLLRRHDITWTKNQKGGKK